MADKIVQLVDKNDNNLFPVAGSMKQGAVTTNLLANAAVTPDKINMSQLVSSLNNYFDTAENITFTIERVGYQSETFTGKKVHLGGNIYVYAGEFQTQNVGSSSSGVKEYFLKFSPAFTAFYGGAINAAASGQTNSSMDYSHMRGDGVDFYINHAGQSTIVGNFIAMGSLS